MFAHHCATIALLTFSWCGNFVRVGTLVLCIHDAVDYWLEVSALAYDVYLIQDLVFGLAFPAESFIKIE